MRLISLVLLSGCVVTVPDLGLTGEEGGVVLLVHGGGDGPEIWADDLVDDVEAVLETPERWAVVPVDWSEDARPLPEAPARGRRIGEALAGQVDHADDVHVIAHSAGAHLAHGLATTLDGPRVQLTLLDPFVGTGLFRWGYGRDRFGEGADFACAYVNRDDGVPSTDGLLEGAHNVDVTALRPADRDDPDEAHRWPITWYAGSAGSGLGLDLAIGAGGAEGWPDLPAGEVTVLE